MLLNLSTKLISLTLFALLVIGCGQLPGQSLAAIAAPQIAQASAPAKEAAAAPSQVLITNARLFDGKSDTLTDGMNVLVKGNQIATISKTAIAAPSGATVLNAKGRTLIPGLIDAHIHLSLGLPQADLLKADPKVIEAAAVNAAQKTLMRGFTTVRDASGIGTFALKRSIDKGQLVGPRIFPSGAMISQTSGHADFRAPQDAHPRWGGKISRAEEFGAGMMADGRDQVLAATREQLRLGASQIKIAAGGGASSVYDPLDVTEYTLDEMKASVEAASDWNTYVMAHVYNPKGIQRAIAAGVKSIEHGHLVDEDTMKLMAEKGIFLSTQVMTFRVEQPGLSEEQYLRLKEAQDGTDTMLQLAKKYNVKVGFGTDLLGGPELMALAPQEFEARLKWFTPVEVLRPATSINAELLALSGPRSPYKEGKLGVIEPGAYADLLLVNGNPLQNLKLLATLTRTWH
jgi:imidazolonepropionase-like amidohydrolase